MTCFNLTDNQKLIFIKLQYTFSGMFCKSSLSKLQFNGSVNDKIIQVSVSSVVEKL